MAGAPVASADPIALAAGLLREGLEQTQALIDHAETVARRTEFQAWLHRLDTTSLDVVQKGGPDAAVTFLLNNAEAEAGKPIDPGLVSLAVGLASRWGWNVQCRVGWEQDLTADGPVSRRPTLLEWLCRKPSTSQLPDGQRWPTTLTEFLRFTQQHNPPRDQEWLIALVVASGANPWQAGDPLDIVENDKGVRISFQHAAFQECIMNEHWDIALQLLSLPHAPSLRETFLHKKIVLQGYWDRGSLIDRCCRYPTTNRPSPSLERGLILLFQDFPEKRLPLRHLAKLPPNVLGFLVKKGRLSRRARTLVSAYWESQVGEDHYNPYQHVQVKNLLNGVAVEGGALRTQQANAWARCAMADWSRKFCWLREDEGFGETWLRMPLPVDGPFAAPWTVLTGNLFKAIATVRSHIGCRGMDWGHWLAADGDACAANTGVLPPSIRPGALREHLLVPAVDGWPVLGMFCLSFLGKEQSQRGYKAQAEDSPEETLSEELEHEAFLFGIDDWAAFADQHAAAAVDATRWLLDRVPPEQSAAAVESLRSVWARALERHPSWMVDQPALMVELLQRLGGAPYLLRRPTSEGWVPDTLSRRPFSSSSSGSFWTTLMVHLSADPRRGLSDPEPPTCRERISLAIEQRLAFATKDDLTTLADWVGCGALAEHHIERLWSWFETEGPTRAGQPEEEGGIDPSGLAALKQSVMDARWGNPSGGPRPRL